MRYFYAVCLLLLTLFSVTVQAQITITSQDMPKSGDTVRYSNANPIASLNLGNTGPNTTWDYSNLTMLTQGIAEFKSALRINPTYGLFFGFNSFGQKVIDSIGVGTIQIKGIYDFYATSQGSFNAVGRGLTALNFPIPSFYSDPDEIYQFPLAYNRVDTSTFSVSFSLLTLGSFTQSGMRVNTVDGWGSLKTPFGTFDVIRVKSEIFERDSLSISQLPAPVAFNNNQVQYKWLAKGVHIPILEIDGNTIGGTFVQTAIKYRDSFHVSPLAPTVDFSVNHQQGVTRDTFKLTNHSNGVGNTYQWTITPTTFSYISGGSATSTNPNVKFHNAGWYSVKLVATNFAGTANLTKTQYIYVGYPDGIEETTAPASHLFASCNGNNLTYGYQLAQTAPVTLTMFSLDGRTEQTLQMDNQAPGTQTGTLDISRIPTGIHLLVLQVNGITETVKFVKE